MSYKSLEIWKTAREVVNRNSKAEHFEEAQQIRRPGKGIKSCVAGGYGRRMYKANFIKFIMYALASNDETIDHLENSLTIGIT